MLPLSSGVGRKPAGCTVEKVAEAAEESSQREKKKNILHIPSVQSLACTRGQLSNVHPLI